MRDVEVEAESSRKALISYLENLPEDLQDKNIDTIKINRVV